MNVVYCIRHAALYMVIYVVPALLQISVFMVHPVIRLPFL